MNRIFIVFHFSNCNFSIGSKWLKMNKKTKTLRKYTAHSAKYRASTWKLITQNKPLYAVRKYSSKGKSYWLEIRFWVIFPSSLNLSSVVSLSKLFKTDSDEFLKGKSRQLTTIYVTSIKRLFFSQNIECAYVEGNLSRKNLVKICKNVWSRGVFLLSKITSSI